MSSKGPGKISVIQLGTLFSKWADKPPIFLEANQEICFQLGILSSKEADKPPIFGGARQDISLLTWQ